MAKMVGLSRNLKMQWLNKTAELVMEGLSEKEIHDQLNEYLRQHRTNGFLSVKAIPTINHDRDASQNVHMCALT